MSSVLKNTINQRASWGKKSHKNPEPMKSIMLISIISCLYLFRHAIIALILL